MNEQLISRQEFVRNSFDQARLRASAQKEQICLADTSVWDPNTITVYGDRSCRTVSLDELKAGISSRLTGDKVIRWEIRIDGDDTVTGAAWDTQLNEKSGLPGQAFIRWNTEFSRGNKLGWHSLSVYVVYGEIS